MKTLLGEIGEIAAGGSRMTRLVRAFDWAKTPLGPAEQWPAELRTVVAQILDSRFPAAIVWGPEMTTIYNDAFFPILGDKPEALGRSFKDVWAEAWPTIGPIAERAFAGESTYIEDFPLTIQRGGGSPEDANFTFCYSPLRLSDGTVSGFLDTVVETTATVRAREEMALVNLELNHRLKNAFALVQAIVVQSLRGVTDKAALDSLRNRLAALARAQDALVTDQWRTASFDVLAKLILAPIAPLERFSMTGPAFTVSSRAAVTVAMILHELATNAAKYGALATESGRVALAWSVDDTNFSMIWRETGGPPVSPPERSGFGTKLLERSLGRECRVERTFAEEGLVVALTCPLQEIAGG